MRVIRTPAGKYTAPVDLDFECGCGARLRAELGDGRVARSPDGRGGELQHLVFTCLLCARETQIYMAKHNAEAWAPLVRPTEAL